MSVVSSELSRRPFWRLTGTVHWMLVVGLLTVVASAPTVVLVPWLAADASNIPLLGVLLLPVGPAVAAALFAWERRAQDGDSSPLPQFARGYRVNLVDSLRVWVPLLLLLVVLGVNLANLGAVRGGGAFGIVSGVLALIAVLWAAHALVISALFSFRWRDTARLAVYHLGASWRATLSALSLVVVTVGVVALVSEWTLLLLAAPLTYLWHAGAAPMAADIKRRFT